MDRREFEYLRDLAGKTIDEDIVLQRKKEHSPVLRTSVDINNAEGRDAKVQVEYNEMTDAKKINVFMPDIGPICRLEVDARPHKTYDRNHKHALYYQDCPHPSINLSRDIVERSDLAGTSIKEVFTDFCDKANIDFNGTMNVEE